VTTEEQIAEQIDGLADADAVGVLALVLERQGLLVDAQSATTVEPRVREALGQPEVAELVGSAPDPVTAGEVARATLRHLAETNPAAAEDIARAITIGARQERFEPFSMLIGTLVVLALRTEVELERKPDEGWHFRFRVKPVKSSALAGILAKLSGLRS